MNENGSLTNSCTCSGVLCNMVSSTIDIHAGQAGCDGRSEMDFLGWCDSVANIRFDVISFRERIASKTRAFVLRYGKVKETIHEKRSCFGRINVTLLMKFIF